MKNPYQLFFHIEFLFLDLTPFKKLTQSYFCKFIGNQIAEWRKNCLDDRTCLDFPELKNYSDEIASLGIKLLAVEGKI